MDYLKVQGTLNDFVLIDERVEGLNLTDSDRARWAVKLCLREGGIGADGILFVNHSGVADAKMRIFNADGSEALMCGNGLRCFGRYVLEDTHKKTVAIETAKAVYQVTLDPDFDQQLTGYHILLDNVQYYGETAEVRQFEKATQTTLTFEHLTVSNPHVVAFCTLEDLQDENLIPLGRLANSEKHIFSEGMNVNLVYVLSERQIYVRTYERGVGITKSCGTGMTSAVTAYAIKTNQLNTPIQVFNDGGRISCLVMSKEQGYAVDFIGNATYMFRGQIKSLVEEALSYTVDSTFETEATHFEVFFQASRDAIKAQ
jgi:diaminopimelate epimerase